MPIFPKIQRSQDKFKQDFTSVFFAKICYIILKIGMGVLIARVLGPYGKGMYIAVARLVGLLSSTSSISMGESVIYYLGRKKLKHIEIVGTTLFVSTSCSLLALSMLFLFKETINLHFFKEFHIDTYWIIYFLIPFTIFNSFVSYALRGFRKFQDYNLLSVMINVIKIIVTAFCFYFIAENYTTALVALLIVAGIHSIWGLILLFKYSMGCFRISWKNVFPLIRYGGLTHFGSIFNQLENQVDIFLLLYFLSPASVGIYSTGWVIASMLQYIANSLNVILFPKLSSTFDKDIALNFTKKSIRCLLFICLGASILVVITAYPFIRICYGSAFVQAFWVTLILLPAIMAEVIFRTLFSWFKGIGRPLVTSVFTGISVIMNIIFNVLLIPRFGIMGAALSAVISYNLRTVLIVYYFIRTTDSKLPDIIFIKIEEIRVIREWIIEVINRVFRSRLNEKKKNNRPTMIKN